MSSKFDLSRFVEAQSGTYEIALAELKLGKKKTHWMWFVFPQMKGLGASSTSEYYGIQNLPEATAYLKHPLLGPRLIQISEVLLQLQTNDAEKVFGFPDNLKLKSSMTLFAALHNHPVFQKVLDKFFNGEKDQRTLELMNS